MKIGVLKNFARFTDSDRRIFLEFCEIFTNTFFTEHLRKTASQKCCFSWGEGS